jgi:hypothetical protein
MAEALSSQSIGVKNCPRTAEHAPTSTPVTAVHALGAFGLLQAGGLPANALDRLREECERTSCDAIHTNVCHLFDTHTLKLLHQTDESMPHEAALLKLPDGYVYFVPKHDNKVLSIVKDAQICLPSCLHPSLAPSLAPDGSRSVFYSIVPKPNRTAFKIVFHDGYTDGHEISRFSMVDHAIAQVAAAIPLGGQPRIIMQADNLGTLFGQSLMGGDANLIKQTFLSLVRQAPGGSVYDTPIETSNMIAQLLQLKNSKGQFSLARLRDGLLGYRNRPDGHRTFVFVAKSDDINALAPADDSALHVYKMLYKDPSPTGNRIFVNVANPTVNVNHTNVMSPFNNNNAIQNPSHFGGDFNGTMHAPSPCPYGTPLIRPDQHTVQNVLGIIEWAIRNSGRDHQGCLDFPQYCAKQMANPRGDEGVAHPVFAQAFEGLMAPPNKEPPPSSSSSMSAHDGGMMLMDDPARFRMAQMG